MCGICGMMGERMVEREFQAFDALFHISALRGAHSSGLMGVHEDPKNKGKYVVATAKSTLSSTEFLFEKEEMFKKYRKENKPRILVGHCRLASQGKIIKENAHPFSFSNIVGVHNGTITSEMINRKKFDTDSETLYYNINEKGIEETIEKLKPHNAAYALVWFNKKEQTLNFLRNYERTLHFAINEWGTLYWASEREFLEFIFKRYKMETKQSFHLSTDTLMSYHINETADDKKFTSKELKPIYVMPPQSALNNFSQSPHNTRKRERFNYVTRVWEEIPDHESTTFNAVSLPPVPGIKTKPGEPVTMYQFKNQVMNGVNLDKVLEEGCAWCREKHFTRKDFDVIQWTKNNNIAEFVCDTCSQSSPDLKEMLEVEGGTYGKVIFRGKDFVPNNQTQSGLSNYTFNDTLPKNMVH